MKKGVIVKAKYKNGQETSERKHSLEEVTDAISQSIAVQSIDSLEILCTEER